MPRWGLTPEERESSPWGLHSDVLEPAKTITDPIHGDIYLTELERQVVDSPPLQRLRRVRQLGMTHLVYPGATHTRFSHSLGALRSAQDLLDAVLSQRHGPSPEPDLFAEWQAEKSEEYGKKVAEATVLVRLGGLLHDLCHVPFGHSVEDDLGILESHDRNIPRFERFWKSLLDDLPANTRKVFAGELGDALRPLILSKEKHPKGYRMPEPATRYPFAADIVGNTICADLLDYLKRDHVYTGLPAEFGHRFIDGFYVVPSTHPYFAQKVVIRIARAGRPRTDVVSELFKFLRFRYELSERALIHHAKLSADAMVGKLLEMWHDYEWLELAKAHDSRIDSNQTTMLDASQLLAKLSKTSFEELDVKARVALEEKFTSYGDDGLLENLRDEMRSAKNGRRQAIFTLANDLLDRQLFKPIGRCSSARSIAGRIYESHGRPDGRRRLEQGAAACAELEAGWKIVLWLPEPAMHLKAADVLVDDGEMIAPLKDRDRVGAKRGEEIYESHEALWAISAFVHPSVKSAEDGYKKIEIALAYLAEKLGGVAWDHWVQEQPTLLSLAIKAVADERGLAEEDRRSFAKQVEDSKTQLAARGASSTEVPSPLVTPTEHAFSLLKEVVGAISPEDGAAYDSSSQETDGASAESENGDSGNEGQITIFEGPEATPDNRPDPGDQVESV